MDARVIGVAIAFVVALSIAPLGPADATSCGSAASTDAAENQYFVHAQSSQCGGNGDAGDNSTQPSSGTSSEPAEVWVWNPICEQHDAATPGGQGLCDVGDKCPTGQELMRHWRIRPPPRMSAGLRCMPTAVANKPEITPGMVAQAFRRIPLPRPVTLVQPGGTTLVNLDTIFSTQAPPFTRDVRMLGQRVHLAIRPVRFVWSHGDATSATTTTPGAPYPARTITYRYASPAHRLEVSVEITWAARYRVDDGPTRTVPVTVTTAGPSSPLSVVEATPALSGAGH